MSNIREPFKRINSFPGHIFSNPKWFDCLHLFRIYSQNKTGAWATDFIALISDETYDKINKSQLSTVFRFIDRNRQVLERFLHSTDRSATGHLEHVKIVVNDFNWDSKVIAWSYDGAAVMIGQVSSLNNWSERAIPHCSFHSLLQPHAKFNFATIILKYQRL